MAGALGRRVPPDFDHVDRYPLRALAEAAPTGVPVIAGVNWYTAFDTPVQDRSGHWWVGRDGKLGTIRGGHCICLEPARDPGRPGGEQDNRHWWPFYDQGAEGACVGFGSSRAMSLLNRKRYQAFWLYRASQDLAGIPRSEDGSDVRAALEVLRTRGHVPVASLSRLQMDDAAIARDKPVASEGISAYRWATTAAEVLAALGTPGADHVTILNSWGTAYPERVLMPATVLERLLREQGEAGVVTDR